MVMTSTEKFIESGLRTVRLEAECILDLEKSIDSNFENACKTLLECKGRIIVTGMGKSGHIGKKIAATLASTGSPAFFVHPGEASHGDMGMITGDDVVVALSNSGTTAEVVTLIPLIKRLSIPLITLTGDPMSTLAVMADTNLHVGVKTEACPLDLAPTSSTTASLVMGDALAIALLEARGFTAEDFAFSHPGGALGRKLLLKVSDIMHAGHAIPSVSPDTTLANALVEITEKGLGMTTVIDDGKLLGVFTDGDLRRTLNSGDNILQKPISQFMASTCKTIESNLLAAEALCIMEEKSITSLVVVDQHKKCIGIVHLHDILKAGVA
ncbi:MAG: KpsF/GutQ family sugar-phosphate isomerase [Pseudomonadales bacterium]|nr:KpsF/GutQ family sugar-phosphate isomerase [Pseudomonadales bacterium]